MYCACTIAVIGPCLCLCLSFGFTHQFFNSTSINSFTLIENDPGDWRPEKECGWRLTFRQPVRKPSASDLTMEMDSAHVVERRSPRQQQSFSGLQSPRWSFLCYSWVQTLFLSTLLHIPSIFHYPYQHNSSNLTKCLHASCV